MIDWGMALSVGLGVAFTSECTILGAILLPKIPLEPGRTWRGTVMAVSAISLIIGGIGGYIAGQFGGRGGGGAVTPGTGVVTTQPVSITPPISTTPAKPQETAPVRPTNYLSSTVDLYFVRDAQAKVTNFTCEIASYRRVGDKWEMAISKMVGRNLEEFLVLNKEGLTKILQEVPEADRANRRLRIFLDPFPGEGTYEQLRRQAEAAGWKVDRKDVAWQPDYPSQ